MPDPVPVRADPALHDYWRRRLVQAMQDRYAGLLAVKLPEDLRVYEHLLWTSRTDVVIELGAQEGGSTLWFRDRLRTLAAYGRARDPRVIAVDVDPERAREGIRAADPSAAGIEVLGGDVRDPELPRQVARHVPPGARCLVVEDTAHVYDTTWAALEGFSRFVAVDGYFVVEDGVVDRDELRPTEDWPRGVLPAVHDWLATPAGSRFRPCPECEVYGITSHPDGFLRRIRAG